MPSALTDAGSVPLPASGTETTSTRPPSSAAVVIGSRIAPWVATAAACIPEIAWPTRGPVRPSPVTTTSAGSGPPGNACRIVPSVRTTGTFSGSEWIPGSSRRSESTGAAITSSAIVASPPSASGLRTTARTTRPTAGMAGRRHGDGRGTISGRGRSPSRAATAARAGRSASRAPRRQRRGCADRHAGEHVDPGEEQPGERDHHGQPGHRDGPARGGGGRSAARRRCCWPAARSSRTRRR